MRLNKLTLVAAIVMGISPFVQAAEDGGTAAPNTPATQTNQGSGKVTFTGSIIDAPCDVDPASVDQKVPLGQIAKNTLSTGEKQSTPQPFSIKLLNCSFGTPAAKNKVTTTFNGVSIGADSKLLTISGQAAGAGVGISTSQGERIIFGKATTAQTLVGDGSQELQFTAFLQGLDDAKTPLKEGDFTAVTNFMLAYQ